MSDSLLDADITGDFVQHLGVEFAEVSGDRVVATWTAKPGAAPALRHRARRRALQRDRDAGQRRCGGVDGRRGKVVGVNNNTDFYRAVREGTLTSTATPLHRGRSQQVWLVETVDADGKVAARGQVRLQNLYPDA